MTTTSNPGLERIARDIINAREDIIRRDVAAGHTVESVISWYAQEEDHLSWEEQCDVMTIAAKMWEDEN